MENIKRKYSDIQHIEDKANCPLSFQQERILYLSKLRPESTIWNKVSCKHLAGEVNVEAMKKAVKALMNRHTVLKTRISFVNNEPVQSYCSCDEETFSLMNADTEEMAVRLLNEEYRRVIALNGGQLFKTILISYEKNKQLLILKLHHIISDASTFQILWKDLKALYNLELGLNCERQIEALPIDYQDYSLWQKEMFAQEKTKEQEEYWLKQFEGELPVLDLTTDYTAPHQITFNGAIEKKKLPKELGKSLLTLSLKNKTILFSTMLTAYYVLLNKYSQQEDIVVGTVFSGRHYSNKLRNAAGFFVNTIGLRADINEDCTFEELLRQIHEKVNEAFYMQDYPFERLIQKLNTERINTGKPLYRAMFNMLNSYAENESFSGIAAENYKEPEINSTQTDLLFEIHNGNEDIEVYVEYNTDIFKTSTIKRMINCYITLLKNITKAPALKIKELDILETEEYKKLVDIWNTTEACYQRDVCIHQLFEAQAAKNPEELAVIYQDKSMDSKALTYGQLNAKANQLAASLREKGVKAGDIIGLMIDKSTEMMVGIMGILKAGAAYLPITPSYPVERVRYMLEDSGASILLTHGKAPEGLEFEGYNLRLEDEAIYKGTESNIENITMSDSIAYVIYTSGSTGKPKGVAVSHKSLHNFLCSMYKNFKGRLGVGDDCLSLANISFDVSVAEIFLPIAYGAKLVLFDNEMLLDVNKLAQTILDKEISFAYIPPALLGEVHNAIGKADGKVKLNKLLVGVEPISKDTLEAYMSINPDMCIINGYGPTEATICAAMYIYDSEAEINGYVPIGRPVNNTKIYILDKNNKPVPVGVAGELCISGELLAQGYIKLPELTAEKFVDNCFACDSTDKYKRMYKTGDLAKWLEDGNIQFIGRIDNQVKVRGYRIELGEIEKTLLEHPAVREAAVVVREDEPDNKLIAAYIVLEENIAASQKVLQEHVGNWLPSYMIPSVVVTLDKLPLNTGGKVDKKALPVPEIQVEAAEEQEAPATAIEQKLIEITENILNITGIGSKDNFFRLGGNSLLTIRFISEIEEAFGISVSMMDFIDLPILADIAKIIEPAVLEAAAEREA